MFVRNLPIVIAIIGLAVVPVSTSWAQSVDTRALMDRIERLERDIRTLNVQIARGGGTPANASSGGAAPASPNDPAYARLNVRVSQIEADMRRATGRVEEISFQVNQVAQQLEKLSTDVNFRLSQLERGGVAPTSGLPPAGSPSLAGQAPQLTPPPSGSDQPALPDGTQVLGTLTEAEAAATPQPGAQAPATGDTEADRLLAQITGEAATPPAPAPAPASAPAPSGVSVASDAGTSLAAPKQTAALPEGTPREKYSHAFGLLRQGQYDLAASALRTFIEEHGDDPLASNAQYWLGETYYVRGAFVEAAETFLEGYQANTQGPKAADALLKLGMSLASLEKKQEACAAFQKLREDYPNAPVGLKNTMQREWQKNGCV